MDWLSPFEPPFRDAVRAALADPRPRRVATFDADGTLWADDIGEAFFRWLAAGELLPGVPQGVDAWAEYEARVAADRDAGYTWAVQVMAGLAESDIQRWAGQLAAAWPLYRPQMRGLVLGLQQAGIETWIVSASNAWVVKAAAPTMGFDPARVIGVSVEVDEDGFLTDVPVRPISSGPGKVQVIDAHIGERPLIAAGDSTGDLAMCEAATVPLVIGSGSLKPIALERGWAVHVG